MVPAPKTHAPRTWPPLVPGMRVWVLPNERNVVAGQAIRVRAGLNWDRDLDPYDAIGSCRMPLLIASGADRPDTTPSPTEPHCSNPGRRANLTVRLLRAELSSST